MNLKMTELSRKNKREVVSLSSVTLLDSVGVKEDKSAKSVSFFCKSHPVKVDGKIISELKKISVKSNKKNARLCLHFGPDALFHEMIILEHKGKYYRPHKHREKGESYHIIEGKLAVFIFDPEGNIIDAAVLEKGHNFIYRVGINMYHAVMPLSKFVVYHESKPGPFTGGGDSYFAPWAPDGSNLAEVRNYQGLLLRSLKNQMSGHSKRSNQ